MPNKKLLKEDLKALLSLNLLDVTGSSKKSKKEQAEILAKFNELSWTIFFQTDGDKLSDKNLKELESLLKKREFEKVEEFFKENFPDLKIQVTNSTIIAKEIVIAQHIGKLLYLVSKSKAGDKDAVDKELKYLGNLVNDRKWEEFSKSYKNLDNIRKKLNE